VLPVLRARDAKTPVVSLAVFLIHVYVPLWADAANPRGRNPSGGNAEVGEALLDA
jgi:hypothetical protein